MWSFSYWEYCRLRSLYLNACENSLHFVIAFVVVVVPKAGDIVRHCTNTNKNNNNNIKESAAATILRYQSRRWWRYENPLCRHFKLWRNALSARLNINTYKRRAVCRIPASRVGMGMCMQRHNRYIGAVVIITWKRVIYRNCLENIAANKPK